MGAMPTKRRPKSPTAIDAAVGRNLRIWRMAKGLSQSQLASRLGVTFQQVQKYEIGSNRIGTGRLVKAAGILGVPISALFDGTDDREPSRSLLALLSDRRSFRLAHAFAAIRSNKFRESLVALVEKLAGLSALHPRAGRGRKE
jgi:transcriptional regulator with XRE-family HTH domain